MPQPRVAGGVPGAIEQASDRAFELRLGGCQRIVMDEQRAEGRHGLDDSRRRLGADRAVEAQHLGAERPLDPVAELDRQRAVADRQKAHRHRIPWYNRARI